MRLIKSGFAAVFLCGVLTMAPAATAQIMGPPLEPGVVEFGYMHKWFHRDMEPFAPTEMRWEVNTLFARYGGFDWLTLSGEGLISSVKHDDFPGMSYHRYALGGGVTARFYELGPWSFAGCFHINEVIDRDDSETRFHKRTYGVIGGLQIGWFYEYDDHRANLWVGPMYVRDVGETYPWDSNDPLQNESPDEFGFAAGAHVVLFKYATGMINVVYADYAQARLGFAISAGGER
jgi:hypothetical protein